MRLRRKIFKGNWLALLCILLSFHSSGQIDSTHLLPKIELLEKTDPNYRISQASSAGPVYHLSPEMILTLGSLDAGQALKYVPGLQIKDYGGIGGIKTVAFRSLGATHTGVVLDNNPQYNAQVGAVNLTQFETFGVHALSFCTGQPWTYSAMPSAYIPANAVLIQSKIMRRSSKLSYELYQNVTTINSYESGGMIRTPVGKKGFFGAQLFAKYGSGEYDYQYKLSGSTDSQKRVNAQLENYKFRIGAGLNLNKHQIKASFYYNYNDQELPGAVILFNPSNDQTIRNADYRADLNYHYAVENWLTKVNAYVQSNYTLYQDPEYLNQQGFLTSEYLQNRYGVGFIANNRIRKINGRIFFGVDAYLNDLKSSEFDNAPNRLGSNAVAGFVMDFERIKLEGNVSYQFINDQFRQADSLDTKNYSEFSPYLALNFLPFKQQPFRVRTFYKRVFRMPTFNDLYYNFIGNTNLKPENAHLINLGLSYELNPRKDVIFEFVVDGYMNMVQNKIIAVPTKNLFNWSMQNIGRTRSTGVDVSILYHHTRGDWKWKIGGAFTYNQSIDISDPNSSSYEHQIPYTPVISCNGTIAFAWKGYELTNNVMYAGERYSLNENIPINYLDPYVDWNIGLSKEFEFGSSYKLFASAKIMNVLGNNYEVVRSFPMPGRYYQFTLKFKYQ